MELFGGTASGAGAESLFDCFEKKHVGDTGGGLTFPKAIYV